MKSKMFSSHSSVCFYLKSTMGTTSRPTSSPPPQKSRQCGAHIGLTLNIIINPSLDRMSLICLVAITNRLSKKDSEIKPHYALLLNQLILLTFLHLLFFKFTASSQSSRGGQTNRTHRLVFQRCHSSPVQPPGQNGNSHLT